MLNDFGREYNQGYTAALLDVERVITNQDFLYDLKRHKKAMTKTNLVNLIKCMVDGRAILRENPEAWVRCNNNAKYGFEICVGDMRNGGYIYKLMEE